MEEDQEIDNHCAELNGEDPTEEKLDQIGSSSGCMRKHLHVVESQPFCLKLRSSPAPCTCSYVIVVPVQDRTHGGQEKCKEPTSGESSVEDGRPEMTAHDGTVEGMKSDGHHKVTGG
jgi:hypothetical protein